MGNNGELTPKQMRFCEEFLVDGNATQAAVRAGYTKRSASSTGHENKKNPKIKKHINELRQARNLRTQVTVDRVLVELAKITFAEKGVKTGYKLKALDMLAKHVGLYDEESRKYLESLKEKESEMKKLKAPIEEDTWAMRILKFLKPSTQTCFNNALKNEQENPATIKIVTGRQQLKFMKELLTEKLIKDEVLAKLDSLLCRV